MAEHHCRPSSATVSRSPLLDAANDPQQMRRRYDMGLVGAMEGGMSRA